MEYFDHAAAIALGLSLAATCGLRAFLPLLVVSALAAMGKLELADSFSWMATPLALVCFGSAVVIEIAGAVYMSRHTPDDGARLTQMVDMVKARQTAKEAAEKEQAEKGKDS